MPAIGRRFASGLFVLALAAPLGANPVQEIFDFLAGMASSLSEGDPDPLLKALDPAMPAYQKLRDDITALNAEAEVQSSIEVRENTGDADHRAVELDWFLLIKPRQDTGAVTRRRQVVKCRLEKRKKKWRIVALTPADFFAPPKLNL